MDIQSEKITLAQLVLQTEDESIIKKVKAIFKKEEKNWWNDLSQKQKDEIEEADREIDRGEFVTSEAFLDTLKK